MKHTFSAYWTDALGTAIGNASVKPYPIECHNDSLDFHAIQGAVNQGIDSHLEAIMFQESKGSEGRRKFTFEPASVPVLVRRLMESGNEHTLDLASAICETLGIELV